MSKTVLAPGNEPLSAVLLKREEYEQAANPNIRLRDKSVLKNGPKSYKIATHWVIIDKKTGEVHHHVLKIETFRHRSPAKTSDGDWVIDFGRSISLDNDEFDEISSLMTFIRAVLGEEVPAVAGDYLVMPLGEDAIEPMQQVLGAMSDGTKVGLLAEALASAKGDPVVLHALVERASSSPEASKEVAAALNLASFSAALQKLEHLIVNNASEGEFQAHLKDNPWMFGSEYSDLLDRRIWVRDKEQDFMLRRTADDYLEIIEIKTPLGGATLFQYDRSHKSYYPRSEMTQVVGQVIGYIDDIDANRFSIKAKDRENVDKIRAKIIIGRDGDEAQCAALRSYNGHLQRIEILTFDQLVRIARRVLSYLEKTFAPVEKTNI